jgi:hypothetical protein
MSVCLCCHCCWHAPPVTRLEESGCSKVAKAGAMLACSAAAALHSFSTMQSPHVLNLLRCLRVRSRCVVNSLRPAPQSRQFTASSLPQKLASQVDEFNREMEALFGLPVDVEAESTSFAGSLSPGSGLSQSLSSPSIPTSATSASAPRKHAVLVNSCPNPSHTHPSQGPSQEFCAEFNLINRSINAAYVEGELSARERRYLRLMLRNSDAQLLLGARMHQRSVTWLADHASLLPACVLLDVLDERVSLALLQQYGEI